MAKLGGSFLLRYWHLGAGARRIEIEHIQSGERALVASAAAALAWIGARAGAAAAPTPALVTREVDRGPAPGKEESVG